MASNRRHGVLLLTSIATVYPTSPELALCRFLDQYGFLPLVVCPQEGCLSDRLQAHGIQVKAVPAIHRWRNLKGRLLAPWIIKKICTFASQYQVALVHSARMSTTPFAVKVARRLRVPCISHIHGVSREPGKFQRYLVYEADVVIGVSRAALAQYSTAKRQEVVVVYNGLDTEGFRARAEEFDARARLGLEGDCIVGMSGAYRMKGLDLFVAAAEVIRNRFPRARFLVMGEFRGRDFQQEISRSVAAPGMNDAFVFAGFQENMAPLLAAADVWAVPSRVDAAPMIALEAMAMGKPVVGSQIGGIPELVRDGETGSIVPPEDPEALAEAICDLLSDTAKRRSFGEAGRRRVDEEFSTQRFCSRMAQVYDSLIGEGPE